MGVLMLNEINYSGGSGGSSLPNGSTVTPTNDIQTWLKCAELTETYTTLSDVLADDDIMEKLFRSENASNYLVRSTTWASDITANQTAMILIGKNDYCANKLLEDSTWNTAICNSTYFESVLNVKVPPMKSNTTPSGYTIFASSAAYEDYYWYKAFDGNLATKDNLIGNTPNDQWLGCIFPVPVNISKVSVVQNEYGQSQAYTMNVKVQYSDDGTTWNDATPSFDTIAGDYKNQVISTDGNAHYRWRLYLNSTSHSGNTAFGFSVIQFYGRASKTIIYSAANDIVSFIDDEGAKVVTTDSTGKGEVTIVCKPNTDITFTSSVAKNPDNLSENYSKVVTVKSNGDAVYVMPNKDVLYWYGYINPSLGGLSTSGYSVYGSSVQSATFNTNNIYLPINLNNFCGTGSGNSISLTRDKKVKMICDTQGNQEGIYFMTTKTYDASTIWVARLKATQSGLKCFEANVEINSSAYMLILKGSNIQGGYFYGIWVEDNTDINDKADITAIAPNEPNATASKAYAAGEHFYKNGKFCTAITAIASGATFTLGTNYTEGTVAEFVGFPSVTQMTAPTIRDSRATNVVGGYKQIGHTVYIDIMFDVNIALTMGGVIPEVSWYGMFDEIPSPKYSYNPLSILAMGSNRPYMCISYVNPNSANPYGEIEIGMAQTNSQGTSLPVGTKIHIRGTYEAN